MGVHTRFSDDDEPETVQTSTNPPAPATNATQSPTPANKPDKQFPASNRIKKPSTHSRNLNSNTTARTNAKAKSKSIKSQIRAINRLLHNKGNTLTPSTYKAKESQLQELTRLHDEHNRRENERKMADEYRMIKFFERRRLQRVLDKILEHGDRKEDEQRKKQVLRDLRYVTEYPKDQRYVALFPSKGHTEESRKRVEEMRREIEGRLEGGQVEEGSKASDGGAEDDFFVVDATG